MLDMTAKTMYVQFYSSSFVAAAAAVVLSSHSGFLQTILNVLIRLEWIPSVIGCPELSL